MLKQALGTAVAAVFATAIAGAQTPAPGQQDQRAHEAGQQMVTVEGCLQADRVAAAQVADDDKTFLLVNAQVQPRTGEMADARPGEPATEPGVGRPGQPGTQPETPVGTTGAAEAITATKFKVSGLDEERLEQYAGQRVRIEGHIERGEQQYGATGAEPRDDARPDADRPTAEPPAVGTTGTPETPATGAAGHDHRAAADRDMKKLKAVSIQPVAGTCPEAPADR